MYNPSSTYRIQLSKNFGFARLKEIIPYLSSLGIKTIYASPFFRAVPGSEHGYDVTDPLMINPEIGTGEEFRYIQRLLKADSMGWIQDIVPNHMAFSVHNPWIYDILKKGQRSLYSDFFDIDWDHPDERFEGKIMLPFFGKELPEIISDGELSVVWNGRSLALKYFDNEFPVNYPSYLMILNRDGSGNIPSGLSAAAAQLREAEEYAPAGEKGLAILAEQYASDAAVAEYVDARVKEINGSSRLMAEIAEMQYYVPVYWKVSEKTLNYRRFFNINGLISLKEEKRLVFAKYHEFIAHLCEEDLVQGLRVDHIDGLYNPYDYLDGLRELAGPHIHITVEKILERNENLEKSWPVQGETGYKFLALVNNLLTNRNSRGIIEDAYRYWQEGEDITFEEVVYRKKKFILYNRMAGDLDNLFNLFLQLEITDTSLYDPRNIRNAIGEFLVNCPLYKIYNDPFTFNDRQSKEVKKVFAAASGNAPELIGELTMLEVIFLDARHFPENKHEHIAAFYRRCMQYTGPLMAKGVEDTAYYTYSRFIVHNEVGDAPSYFGISAADFHKEMIRQAKDFPLTLNATSTHDTKRGEDTRARLTAVSDFPEEWLENIRLWRMLNREHKKRGTGADIPAAHDEYFIYQAIAGSMPAGSMDPDDFTQRMVNYMTKALREGKQHTAWSEPDEEYESRTEAFLRAILAEDSGFMKAVKPFVSKMAFYGVINSLAQVLLKLTVPGIPDIYQGCESWNFSFVDPDNRREVNYGTLSEKLGDLRSRNVKLKDLVKDPFGDSIKLLLTSLLLDCRNDEPGLFEKGEYVPLKVKGSRKKNILAFGRSYKGKVFITVVPLHFAEVTSKQEMSADWGDTCIDIPDLWPEEYEDILNGGSFMAVKKLPLADLLRDIPFGFLKGVKKEGGERIAGVLMHITSLPGKYETGTTGDEAYKFADFLCRNGQRYWQMLPLNQTDIKWGYSPYSPLSAFAGNVLLISPEKLSEQDLLASAHIPAGIKDPLKADFTAASGTIENVIGEAYANFKNRPFRAMKKEFNEFCEKEKYWLHDYTLFAILRKKNGFAMWNEWPVEFRKHDTKALDRFHELYEAEIEREKFAQFIFMDQWKKLKNYCNDRDISILGDLPLYVSYDSADVWAHRGYFDLKGNGEMRVIAGVPPDYFNENGQLWNMPIYKWESMKDDGFKWWRNRIRKNLELFDLVRLDHFRGLSAYWEVPEGEATAKNGRWVPAPGEELLDAIREDRPDMPFVAEDLGYIDQPVYDLRDRYELPGMEVLQFAFGGDFPGSLHIPHNHKNNCLVYTGTHDNNTVKGWFTREAGRQEKKKAELYAGRALSRENCSDEFIRLAYSSVSKLVIIPAQDILGLGEESRMNMPSEQEGNWTWRMRSGEPGKKTEKSLRRKVKIFGRL